MSWRRAKMQDKTKQKDCVNMKWKRSFVRNDENDETMIDEKQRNKEQQWERNETVKKKRMIERDEFEMRDK